MSIHTTIEEGVERRRGGGREREGGGGRGGREGGRRKEGGGREGAVGRGRGEEGGRREGGREERGREERGGGGGKMNEFEQRHTFPVGVSCSVMFLVHLDLSPLATSLTPRSMATCRELWTDEPVT